MRERQGKKTSGCSGFLKPDRSTWVDVRLLVGCPGLILALHVGALGMGSRLNDGPARGVLDMRSMAGAGQAGVVVSPSSPASVGTQVPGMSLTSSNATPDADSTLVRKIRGGDPHAFEVLVRRYVREAHALARSVVGSDDLADDVCQEAFLSALRSMEQCKDPTRFRSWLMAIVRNRALTLRSSEIRRAETSLDSWENLSSGDDPLTDMERLELKGAVSAAVDLLSGLRKKVFVLHEMEGLDHGEISRRLGISRGASRVHLHAARRILKGQLNRAWLEKV